MWLLLACATARPTPAPRPVVPATAPPLYGFWGLNGAWTPEGFADLRARTGLTTFQVACSDPAWCVGTFLPAIRAAGLHVSFRMTDDHAAYTTAGAFDLTKWEAQVARWDGSGVQTYIDDGTLVGHMLLDDVATFDAGTPSGDTLDAMGAYSKAHLPGLLTWLRQKPTDLPVPSAGAYRSVDACDAQYEAAEGDVRAYATAQADAARRLDLGLILGLNIADGGDGSSGQAGWRAAHWAMSAAEIDRYGAVLSDVPTMGAFLAWEYDGLERWSDGTIGATWFRRPDTEAALHALGERVAHHPPVGLRRD